MVFKALPLPDSELTFLTRQAVSESRKRGRAAADVDGEHSCLQKKKRRLRLFLITSRLSPQYSHPATNIVDRGSSKIAVWVKQKAVGRNLLRKAAVLNHVRRSAVAERDAVSRRRLLVEQEKEQRQLELARLTFDYGAVDTHTRPVHSPAELVPPLATIRNASHVIISGSPTSSPAGSPTASRSPSPTSTSPSPTGLKETVAPSPNAAYALSPPRSHHPYEPHLPSPLGLSNYDALDAEASDAGPSSSTDLYADLDDDGEEDRYSSFWDEEEDVDSHARFDSPFAPLLSTSDAQSMEIKGVSHEADAFEESDGAGSAQGRMDVDGEGAHAVCQASPLDAKRAAAERWYYRSPSVGGLLAVRYPGAPVPSEERCCVPETPPVAPRLVPASMSPNFRAVDEGG
ncbi:hypothetical protein E8E13_004759 [Curvularia kusanoi]|uniref:Uncharacterized protein n=1 Tax=Curvularia kusanoi TaxID=90978 RepID=A0A9P4T7V3_CURKU|nr:hypothetical protein E8E13_004759 [Curvularia kusanoi]